MGLLQQLRGNTAGQKRGARQPAVVRPAPPDAKVAPSRPRGLLSNLLKFRREEAPLASPRVKERQARPPSALPPRSRSTRRAPPQSPAASTRIKTSVEFLGHSCETRTAHLTRHDGGRRDCGRCRFYMWGSKWLQSYGRLTLPAPPRCRDRRVAQWIAERPDRWPGPWGLGCVFCAAFHKRLVESGQRAVATERFGTKWARYEVRAPTLQAQHIRQHLGGACHALSAAAFLKPDEAVQTLLQPLGGDEGLLDGAVPQPADWLRAWRGVKSPQSYLAAELHLDTEHYIRSIRAQPVRRRAVRSLVATMAEVVRSMKRHWVRHAYSITISLDDKGPMRLIRFKADCLQNLRGVGEAAPAGGPAPASAAAGEAAPAREVAPAGEAPPIPNQGGPDEVLDPSELAQWGASTSPHSGACAGIVGLLRPHNDAEVEDFDEDHSLRMCESIVQAIYEFCTPRGQPRDDSLAKHFFESVRVYMSDGAASAQKCGEFLRRWCRNLCIVARDPTHAIRIACRDPLHLETRFEAQWQRLFNGKHALIADIQNSDQMKAKLVACQRRVLSVDDQQGGGLNLVMKHFCFVKPRFESFVGPRRKYICLLQAIVMLLCGIVDTCVSRRRNAAARNLPWIPSRQVM